MSDYQLTAGQQQQLIQFLENGKSIYLEANDFAYFQKSTPFFQMFGAAYLGDGAASNNVSTLTGQSRTLMEGAVQAYLYGSSYPDEYVDELGSNGCDLLFKCQQGKGRVAAYAGANGTYRTLFSTVWLGAMKDASSNYTKKEIMAAYMRYLKGDRLVVALDDEVPVTTGAQVDLFLECPASEAGRSYGIFGSVSGTSPGTPAGSVTLPLNYDAFMSAVIANWNSAVFYRFLGQLDPAGRAWARLDTLGPVDPSFAGISMYFAFLLSNPMDFASNAVEIPLTP